MYAIDVIFRLKTSDLSQSRSKSPSSGLQGDDPLTSIHTVGRTYLLVLNVARHVHSRKGTLACESNKSLGVQVRSDVPSIEALVG